MSSPPTFKSVADAYLDTLESSNGSRAPPPMEHTVLLLMSRLGDVAAFTGRSLSDGVPLTAFEQSEVRELLGQLAIATTCLGVACDIDVGEAALSALGSRPAAPHLESGHVTRVSSSGGSAALGTPPRPPAAVPSFPRPEEVDRDHSPPVVASTPNPTTNGHGSHHPASGHTNGHTNHEDPFGLRSPTSGPAPPLPAGPEPIEAGPLSPNTADGFWPLVDQLRRDSAQDPERFRGSGAKWCVVKQGGAVEDLIPGGRNVDVPFEKRDEYFALLERHRPRVSAFNLTAPREGALEPPALNVTTPNGDDAVCQPHDAEKFWQDIAFLSTHDPTAQEVTDLGLRFRMPYNGHWYPLVQDGEGMPVIPDNYKTFLGLVETERQVRGGFVKRSASMRRIMLPDGVRQVARFDPDRNAADAAHVLAPATNAAPTYFNVDFDPERAEDVMPDALRRCNIPPTFPTEEHYVTFLVEHPEQFRDMFPQILRHPRLLDSWKVTFCVPNDKFDPPARLSNFDAHARCGIEDLKPDGRHVRVTTQDLQSYASLVYDAAKHLPPWAAPAR